MDIQEFLLSSIAPFMAAVVEAINPVNAAIIKRSVSQDNGIVSQLVSDDTNSSSGRQQKENLANAIARVSGAAVEAYSLVLTWIGITSGITPILVELFGPLPTSIIVGIWLFLSAVFGLRFFQQMDYYERGSLITVIPLRRTKTELLSYILIIINASVVVIIFLFWLFTHKN